MELAREKAAKAHLSIDIRQGEIEQPFPVADKSQDVIYAHLSLHYFDSPTTREILERCHRALKPGGVIALLVNTIEDPEIPNLKPIGPDYYLEPATGLQKRYFSVTSMKALTEGLFEPLLADSQGSSHKDHHRTLIRFVGRKRE